jgi:hypothetical protein
MDEKEFEERVQKEQDVLELFYAVCGQKDFKFLYEQKKAICVYSNSFFDVEFSEREEKVSQSVWGKKTRLRIDTTSTMIVLHCIEKYTWEYKLKRKDATTLEAIVEEILRVAKWVEDGGDIKLRQELLGRQKKELHVGRRLRRRKDHKRRKLVSTFEKRKRFI